jgi:hypothetical protein
VEHIETIAAYGAAWNEPDEAKRGALLEQSWADDGSYHDPQGTADGRTALVAHIGGFHKLFPGHSIEFASGIDSNGVTLRWAWEMRSGSDVVLEGVDFAELAPDGRIQRIAGFFGPFPRPSTHSACRALHPSEVRDKRLEPCAFVRLG